MSRIFRKRDDDRRAFVACVVAVAPRPVLQTCDVCAFYNCYFVHLRFLVSDTSY